MTVMAWITGVNLIAQTTLIVLQIILHIRKMKKNDSDE